MHRLETCAVLCCGTCWWQHHQEDKEASVIMFSTFALQLERPCALCFPLLSHKAAMRSPDNKQTHGVIGAHLS